MGTREKLKKKNHAFLFYMVLYHAVVLVITIILIKYGIKVALKMAGYSYLNFENLSGFIKSPMTIVLFLLLVCLISLFYLFEYTSFVIYYRTRDYIDDLKLAHIILPGLYESFCLLKCRKNLLFPLFCLVSFLGSSYPLIIDIILKQRIPSYFMQRLLKSPYTIAIMILVSILLLCISYRGIFVFFYINHRKMNFFEAYKKSRDIVRTRRREIVWTLMKTNLAIWALYFFLYYFIVFMTGIIVFFAVEKSVSVVTFLTMYDYINRDFTMFFGIIGINMSFYVIYRLFKRYGECLEDVSSSVCILQRKISNNRKYTFGVHLISGIIVIVLTIVFAFEYRNNFMIQKAPMFGISITAHRGYSSQAPENTLPAIQGAIDAMSDFVEVDVQQTKDGVLVLLHDTNLKRTTGINKNIWNVTYDEIQKYDAAKTFLGENKTTWIPTLEEALLLCQNSICMNIEIKLTNHEDQLVEKVVQLIEQYDMEEQCVISSNNYGVLKRVKNANEQLKTGYIMSFSYGYLYNKEYLDFFSVKSSFITPDMVRMIHGYGKEIHAWTVNSVSEAERMKQMGVDNIITDYPIRIRETIYEDRLTTSFMKFMKTLMK